MDPIVNRVTSTIANAVRPKKIILFGSRARDESNPESDLDLLIVYDGALSKREVKLRIRRLFPQPDFSMDLFVLTPDEFERQQKVVSTVGRVAVREGVVCYG